MKRELDESDDHVDVGLSQATSLAASSSSQLRYGSGPTIDFGIYDCDLADSAPDSDDETQLVEPSLQKFLSILLFLVAVGLAMVSTLPGCDYGDATTGFELAVNAVYPVAKSQADVHKLGDISSATHFFQFPPNSSKLQCYDSYLQSLSYETLKNLSSPLSKRKYVEFKKNALHHLEIVLVFLTRTIYDDSSKIFKPLRLFSPRSIDLELPVAGAHDIPGTIALLSIKNK
jgi:hypothetical protein